MYPQNKNETFDRKRAVKSTLAYQENIFFKTILQTKCQYIRDHIIEVTIIMIRNYDKLTKPKLLFKADSYKQQT